MVLNARLQVQRVMVRLRGRIAPGRDTLTIHYFESDYKETILLNCTYSQLRIIPLAEK